MFASFLIGWIKDSYKRQDGQAMAEYGIILALVAVACVVVLGFLGGDISNELGTLVNAL